MIFIQGQKYACTQCIRGHRASNCNHTDRPLNVVNRKGRPPTQCSSCRELRLTRKAHVKCECREKRPAAPSRSAIKAKGPESTSPAAPESPPKLRRIEAHAAPKAKVSSIESLLNPCNCSGEQFCTCCKPGFTEYLARTYPPRVVEQEARSLGESLKRPFAMMTSPSRDARPAARCPSGPDAACCAADARDMPSGPRTAGSPPRRVASLSSQAPHHPHRLPPLSRPPLQHQASAARPPVAWAGPQQHQQRQPYQYQHQLQNHNPSMSGPRPAAPFAAGGQSAPVRRPPPPGLPSEVIERPNCSCGCQCGKKLDMLIRAIESRLGQDGLDELAAGARLPTGRSDSQWGRGPMSPPVSAHARPISARTFPPPMSSSSSARAGSTAFPATPLGIASAPQSSRSLSFRHPLPLAPIISRSRSSSGSSIGSSGSDLRLPQLPASQSPTRELSTPQPAHAAQPRAFASGVVPPVTSTVRQSSSSSSSIRAGWQPGDPSNPEVDSDGALACSCGCHKPFAECTDCLEDECEDMLLRSSM